MEVVYERNAFISFLKRKAKSWKCKKTTLYLPAFLRECQWTGRLVLLEAASVIVYDK